MKIITDKKIDLDNKLRSQIDQIPDLLLRRIEVIYLLPENKIKFVEYSNEALLIPDSSSILEIYKIIIEKVQNDKLIQFFSEEYKSKLKLWKERCNFLRTEDSAGMYTFGIFFEPDDRKNIKNFIFSCFSLFLQNDPNLAVIYPKSYNTIKKLYK